MPSYTGFTCSYWPTFYESNRSSKLAVCVQVSTGYEELTAEKCFKVCYNKDDLEEYIRHAHKKYEQRGGLKPDYPSEWAAKTIEAYIHHHAEALYKEVEKDGGEIVRGGIKNLLEEVNSPYLCIHPFRIREDDVITKNTPTDHPHIAQWFREEIDFNKFHWIYNDEQNQNNHR